jgi:ABC-type nitrate/sulfonate/bicarbonate transport system ATPase subunit
VLLVTHQIDEAVYLSDRVLIFTVRPGRLKQELRIELPRPRDLSIKRTGEFVRYTTRSGGRSRRRSARRWDARRGYRRLAYMKNQGQQGEST